MARKPRDQKRDKLTSQKLIYQSYGQIGMFEVRRKWSCMPLNAFLFWSVCAILNKNQIKSIVTYFSLLLGS